MHILVIDDDEDTCHLLDTVLGAGGYEVRAANTGEEGLHMLQRCDPDLVMLDVMLPDTDGWRLCRLIRTFSSVPIFMISAFARTVDDMARGLDSGADDYLAKPLDFDLLKAHVRALLRRSAQVGWRSEHLAYLDSHLTVDLRHQQVYVRGNLVILSLLEWQLLELLVCNINQTVPTLEIAEELWPGMADESSMGYVRTYIKRLRQAIEPDSRRPQYLLTERGLGYRFASPEVPYTERT